MATGQKTAHSSTLAPAAKSATNTPIVSFKDIVKHYPKHTALKGIPDYVLSSVCYLRRVK
jgi:hypothetical protein